VIGAMAKAYTMTFDEVLDMSFQNLALYGMVLPSNSFESKDNGEKDEEVINMDDPTNHHILKEMINQSI